MFIILGLSVLLKGITIASAHVDLFIRENMTEREKQIRHDLHKLVSTGIKDGTVQPQPTIVFEPVEVETAFRFMMKGQHIGKIVIKVLH